MLTLQLANGHASENGTSHTSVPETACAILCREYRIPIRAALNGTAGVHTLKVVISPAAIVANQKAADYKYNVPGLTQPGTMLFLFVHILLICHLCSHLLLLRSSYTACCLHGLCSWPERNISHSVRGPGWR